MSSTKKKPPKTGILIEYYEGPYGPTILLDTINWEELQKIRSIFFSLARGEISFVNLITVQDVTAIDINKLVLRRLGCQEEDRTISLERVKNGKRQNEFIWSLKPVDWWACVNIIDGFEKDRAGHNYLTEEGVDEALLVLQYKQSLAYRGIEST